MSLVRKFARYSFLRRLQPIVRSTWFFQKVLRQACGTSSNKEIWWPSVVKTKSVKLRATRLSVRGRVKVTSARQIRGLPPCCDEPLSRCRTYSQFLRNGTHPVGTGNPRFVLDLVQLDASCRNMHLCSHTTTHTTLHERASPLTPTWSLRVGPRLV